MLKENKYEGNVSNTTRGLPSFIGLCTMGRSHMMSATKGGDEGQTISDFFGGGGVRHILTVLTM